jgi:hypothetical protein
MDAPESALARSCVSHALSETAAIVGIDLLEFVDTVKRLVSAALVEYVEDRFTCATKAVDIMWPVRGQRYLGMRDERDVAVAGGRERLVATGAPELIPASAGIMCGKCDALIFLALTATMRKLLRRADGRYLGDSVGLLARAIQVVDTDIDVSVSKLGWQALAAHHMVTGDRIIQARGFRTCSDVVDAIRFLQCAWSRVDPRTAPLERYIQHLHKAIGRLSLRAVIAAVQKNYAEVEALLDVRNCRTAVNGTWVLSPGFFGDMWLILEAMTYHHRKIVVMLREIDSTSTELFAAWRAIQQLDAGLTTELVVRIGTSEPILVPRRDQLLAWIQEVAKSIASVDSIMGRVTVAAENAAIMYGNKLVHAASRPLEDNSSTVNILIWQGASVEDINACTVGLGQTPDAVLWKGDPDNLSPVRECLLNIFDILNLNYGEPESVLQFVFREAEQENLGDGIVGFTVPALVETHSLFVVTKEGERTALCPFMVAFRVWLYMCLDQEVREAQSFKVSPVMHAMTRWLRVHCP